jgi:hypothetical protein
MKSARRRWRHAVSGLAVSSLLSGLACSSGSDPSSPCWTQVVSGELPAPRPIAWTQVADLALAAQSASDPVSLPGTDVVYRLSTAGCVQIDTLTDPQGSAWVTPPTTLSDYDLFCKSCPQRVSVGVRSGLYVLPSSDPQPKSATRLDLRAVLRDCGTLLPSQQRSFTTARLRCRARSPTRSRG